MKIAIGTACFFLSGCANFDIDRFSQAMQQTYQAQNAIYQQSIPYTIPQAPAPRMMVLTGFLNSQSVNGPLRYCKYSNGVVTTIAAVELCPMNNQ